MAMENARRLAIGCTAAGWLGRLMSAWQPVQPNAPWTEGAKWSASIVSESVAPSASFVWNPGDPWQIRHCWLAAGRAAPAGAGAGGLAAAAGAIIPANE